MIVISVTPATEKAAQTMCKHLRAEIKTRLVLEDPDEMVIEDLHAMLECLEKLQGLFSGKGA